MENKPTIISDKFGNSIIVSGNVILLQLKSESRQREIGVIIQKKSILLLIELERNICLGKTIVMDLIITYYQMLKSLIQLCYQMILVLGLSQLS